MFEFVLCRKQGKGLLEKEFSPAALFHMAVAFLLWRSCSKVQALVFLH